jgi:hypothetical protein
MIGFLKAAYVAIRFGDRRRWRAKGFALLLWRSVFAGRADIETRQRRMAFCRQCPIFYKPLQTCGSPLTADKDLGCYCHMPTKARLRAARCWLYDETAGQMGWPKELNG